MSPPSPSKRVSSAESPYHRGLRALLRENKSARQVWTALLLEKGLPVARGLLDLRNEIETAKDWTPRDLRLDPRQKEHLKECYLAKKVLEHEKLAAKLMNILLELDVVHDRLRTNVKRLYNLLIEASQTRGIDFAFGLPMWTSWTLEGFYDAIAHRADFYSASLVLIRSLAETLADPTTPVVESQAALSHWACQPLLPSPAITAQMDELLDIEVGPTT